MAPEQNLSLISKLAEVMKGIKHVAKRGRNEFHKYDYATEADIAEAVRSGLADAGIMLVPSVKEVTVEQIPKKAGGFDRLVRLLVEFTVTNGTESIRFNAVGEGQDSGDKASYKAMTGATKYALLKLFLIPTGDDPENDSKEREKEDEEARTKVERFRDLYKKAKEKKVVQTSSEFQTWIRERCNKPKDTPLVDFTWEQITIIEAMIDDAGLPCEGY